MDDQELLRVIEAEIRSRVWESRPTGEINGADDAAAAILAVPGIAEALAQKRYADKMMGHSTGGGR